MKISCHLSMDVYCQEMRDVCKGGSESLDSHRSLYSECHRRSLVELSQQRSFFLTVERAVTRKEKGRERRALLSCGWLASFLRNLGARRVVLAERGWCL